MQDIYGQSEYFKDIVDTTKGSGYKWDENFICLLDRFFRGEELFNMTRSDKNRIEKYFLYACKNLSQNDRDFKYMADFDCYLANIKECKCDIEVYIEYK